MRRGVSCCALPEGDAPLLLGGLVSSLRVLDIAVAVAAFRPLRPDPCAEPAAGLGGPTKSLFPSGPAGTARDLAGPIPLFALLPPLPPPPPPPPKPGDVAGDELRDEKAEAAFEAPPFTAMAMPVRDCLKVAAVAANAPPTNGATMPVKAWLLATSKEVTMGAAITMTAMRTFSRV